MVLTWIKEPSTKTKPNHTATWVVAYTCNPISALERCREDDQESEARLGYRKPYLKKKRRSRWESTAHRDPIPTSTPLFNGRVPLQHIPVTSAHHKLIMSEMCGFQFMN